MSGYHYGTYPLHTAVEKRNKDMVELLLSYGAKASSQVGTLILDTYMCIQVQMLIQVYSGQFSRTFNVLKWYGADIYSDIPVVLCKKSTYHIYTD